MKKYKFYNDFVNPGVFKRVNKTAAKKAYLKGERIIICPVNFRPELYKAVESIQCDVKEGRESNSKLFEEILNCALSYFPLWGTKKETGSYLAYYIPEKEAEK